MSITKDCKGCGEVLGPPAAWTFLSLLGYCSPECREGTEVRRALTPAMLVTGVDHSLGRGSDATTIVTMRSVDGKVEIVDMKQFRTDIHPGSKIKVRPLRQRKP